MLKTTVMKVNGAEVAEVHVHEECVIMGDGGEADFVVSIDRDTSGNGEYVAIRSVDGEPMVRLELIQAVAVLSYLSPLLAERIDSGAKEE